MAMNTAKNIAAMPRRPMLTQLEHPSCLEINKIFIFPYPVA
jgi:hypothetical protein